MIIMTMIARISDGLPLAASVQEDEQVGRGIPTYQSQAKQLFKKLDPGSPAQMSLETGPYYFQ